MDLATIIFGALALAFALLIILAIRKIATGKEAPPPEAAEEESREEVPAPAIAPEEAPKEAPPPADVEPGHELAKRPPQPVDRAEERRRLSKGLAKTRNGFIAKLSKLFSGKAKLDADMLDQVEEILFTADIGVRTSQELIEGLRSSKGEVDDPAAIWDHIKRHSAIMMQTQEARPLDVDTAKPFVILVVGVNGTGKTTTIGKLATMLADQGRKVMLAAGDTFRAAAVEQLEVWGGRAGCVVVRGKEGADPSSVVVEAMKRAKAEGFDVVIADTAGRLHTKVELMEELQKMGRTIAKHSDGGPHETLLVLDATTGQNAIVQATIFKEAMNVSGLVLTKLDGTAKGGVVLGICNELQLPVRFIGIGEQKEDLRVFEPEAFVDALYEAAGEHDND